MMKAFGAASWPLDWVIGLVKPPLVRKGIAAGYGSKHISYSLFYPKSAWGDLEVAVVYTPIGEIYQDLAGFMATELSSAREPDSVPSPAGVLREHSVMNTSSELVLHGSTTRCSWLVLVLQRRAD
jgi:hypothetical protein